MDEADARVQKTLVLQRQQKVDRTIARALLRWDTDLLHGAFAAWCCCRELARRAAELARQQRHEQQLRDDITAALQAERLAQAEQHSTLQRKQAGLAAQRATTRALVRWRVGSQRAAFSAWRGGYQHAKRAAELADIMIAQHELQLRTAPGWERGGGRRPRFKNVPPGPDSV